MYKRVKLLHNLDELEQNEEVELQLEDHLILENGKLNEKDDVLYNKDMKRKLIRDFHRKQQMFEEVTHAPRAGDGPRPSLAGRAI